MESAEKLKYISSIEELRDTDYFDSIKEDKQSVLIKISQGYPIMEAIKTSSITIGRFYLERKKDKNFDASVKALSRLMKSSSHKNLVPIFSSSKQRLSSQEIQRRGNVCKALRYYKISTLFNKDETIIYKTMIKQPICYISHLDEMLGHLHQKEVIQELITKSWIPIIPAIENLPFNEERETLENEEIWKDRDTEPSRFLLPLSGSASMYLDEGWQTKERSRIEVDYAEANGIQIFQGIQSIIESVKICG